MMGRKAEAASAWGRRRRIRRPDLPGQQGNNSEFLGNQPLPGKHRLENIFGFSYLRDSD
jgi:hypothetical protein